MKYTFTIPGNPVPLARARINTKSYFTLGAPKMWDPNKERKLVTAITLQSQYENIKHLTGPVHIDATFYMPIPKSKPKRVQQEMNGKHHTSKPDIDNLLKAIFDSATGILYHDDCIIASVTIKKLYDPNPRTVFTIESITHVST